MATERAKPADRAARTRKAILAAAVTCFYEKGYEPTSVQEVVDRASVTKGAFYYHFTSKEALLLMIHDEFMDVELQGAVAISGSALSPPEKLAALVEGIVQGAQRFQQHYTIFFEQRRFLSHELFQEVRAKRQAYEQVLVDVIVSGIEQRYFKPIDSPRVLAFGIVGMAAWAYQWYRPRSMSTSEIAQMYSDVILGGLLPPRHDSATSP